MTAIPDLPKIATTVRTVADLLHDLGDVPADRVLANPSPGTVTFEELVEINETNPDGRVYEWVDGTLVEKAVGQYESWLGTIISGRFDRYLEHHDLGMLLGEAGVLRILPNIGRAGDVTFIAWASLPGGQPPPRADRVPAVVPDLVVEVLSESNRPGEMARKRREYFTAGVKQVWEIDPEMRAAIVYTAEDQLTPVPANGAISGGDVLPGFSLSLQEIFDRADRQRPTA